MALNWNSGDPKSLGRTLIYTRIIFKNELKNSTWGADKKCDALGSTLRFGSKISKLFRKENNEIN